MKISAIKRLLAEWFPDDVKKWIGSLLAPLNDALDQIVKALGNQLTLAENLKSQTWKITLSATQTYPVTLAYSLNEAPTGVWPGRVASRDGSALPAHSFTWVWNGTKVLVTFNGLSAVQYDVTIIAQV